jgi:hypothetical protein
MSLVVPAANWRSPSVEPTSPRPATSVWQPFGLQWQRIARLIPPWRVYRHWPHMPMERVTMSTAPLPSWVVAVRAENAAKHQLLG